MHPHISVRRGRPAQNWESFFLPHNWLPVATFFSSLTTDYCTDNSALLESWTFLSLFHPFISIKERVKIFDVFCGGFQYRYLTTQRRQPSECCSKCHQFYCISVSPVRERERPGVAFLGFNFLTRPQHGPARPHQHLMDWNIYHRNVVWRIIEVLTWEPGGLGLPHCLTTASFQT